MSLGSLAALRLFTGEAKCLTQMKIFPPPGARLPLAGKVLHLRTWVCSSAGFAEDVCDERAPAGIPGFTHRVLDGRS